MDGVGDHRPAERDVGLPARFANPSKIILQVALGGWVSSNYAVLACSDFPTCQGNWWPDMRIGEGFVLARPLGAVLAGAAHELERHHPAGAVALGGQRVARRGSIR